MLQLRRPFKALSPDWYTLCRRSGETVDYLFLYHSITLGLWHKIFSQTAMVWVQPGSICNVMHISFKCFGNFTRDDTLWKSSGLTLLWIVWRQRNDRIFEDTWKMTEMMWDLLHFHVSFWAYCTNVLKSFPLSVMQLYWLSVCTPQGWVYLVKSLVELQELLYLYSLFWFLLYSPTCIVKFSLGLLIRFVFHGEDFSSFSCFYSLFN